MSNNDNTPIPTPPPINQLPPTNPASGTNTPMTDSSLLNEGLQLLEDALTRFSQVSADPRTVALTNMTHGILTMAQFALPELLALL